MASTTLTRTPSSAGNQKTWTLSAWVKNSYGGMFFCVDSYGASKSLQSEFYQGADYFAIAQYASGSGAWGLTTNRLFRDRNAWYHLVISVDTTQATSSDRVKIYVNGVQETSFSSETYPSLNYDTGVNTAIQHMIGNRPSASIYFDGLMAHFHFIDGTAYDASDFGETDSTSGIWKPKTAPSVTYGTNGFFLKMENSGAMGTDSSGNSNTFTVSGTLTQNVDTPSNNFATLNPIANGGANLTITNGNTTVYDSDSTWRSGFGGFAPSSGKWYFEVKRVGASSNVWIGIMDSSQLDGTGAYKFVAKSRGYGYSAGGEKGNNGTETGSWGDTYAQNDIIGVAMDLDNNKIYFSKNGTWQDSGDPTSGATGTGSMYDLASGYNYFPATSLYSTTAGVSFNFGQGFFGTTAVASAGTAPSEGGIFEYDCPSGYQALCTKGINSF